MRLLSMLHHLPQLFRIDKGLEAGAEFVLWLHNHRVPVLPVHVLRLGEKVLEQLILAAYSHFHNTIIESTHTKLTRVERVASSASVRRREEFDVAIHSLSSVAVHNDMNSWTDGRSDDLGMMAEKGENLGLGQVVGNLVRDIILV